jgi:hypothetical protein
LITSHGGSHIETLDPSQTFSTESVTHIISPTITFQGFDLAKESFIPIVKPKWVSECLARKRLVPVKVYDPDPRMIFSDVVVLCVDLPPGDTEAIISGVVALGGQYLVNLTRSVTHIVALNDENPLCQAAQQSKDVHAVMVLPHWFDDCLKLRKRLGVTPYLLPNPEIAREGPLGPIPVPNNLQIVGATKAHSLDLPPKTHTIDEGDACTVFKGKTVRLGNDLALSRQILSTIGSIVEAGGGRLAKSAKAADIVICRYRDGNDYTVASREAKVVGTLTWLYHLIAYNKWAVPTQMLLHYPVARNGLPGFNKLKIAVSNYSGPARQYLESLIEAAGGTYTKSLKPDNTHLLTASSDSEKSVAADRWNIEKVNHLWLEESYARWQVQKLSDPRYTHFPPRTNLGEIVGRTPIDMEIVREVFLPREPRDNSAQASPLQIREKDKIASIPDSSTLQLLTPTKSSATVPKGSSQRSQPKQGDDELHAIAIVPARVKSDMPSDKMDLDEQEGFSTAQTTILAKSVIRQPQLSPGIEQDITPRRASRAAKEKAAVTIRDTIMPDIALYQKEKNRKSGHIWGGVRSASALNEASPAKANSLKRSSSPAIAEQDDRNLETRNSVENEPKRVKTEHQTSRPTVKLLVTGYQRWKDSGKTLIADQVSFEISPYYYY